MEKQKIIYLKIVCPSKGRWDNVITTKVVDDLIIVCPDDEKELYKANYPDNEIIGQPKDVKGITATRQFILDTFENVFMIDDDVEYVRRMFTEEDEPYKINDPKVVRDLIVKNAHTCRDIGAFMFGFGNIRRPVHYLPQKPFKYTGYANASYCGYLKGHKLKYDLSYSEGEDHYMSCLNVFKNRFMFIDMRYAFFTKDNFKAKGGCCDDRTSDDMLEVTLKLRTDFGDAIQLKRTNPAKQTLNLGERSLKFPF